MIVGLLVGCKQEETGKFSYARPPQRYQGNTTFVVQEKSPQDLKAICEALMGTAPPVGTHYTSCENIGLGVIYADNACNYPDEVYAQHFCHGKAHLHPNDWPADHPR